MLRTYFMFKTQYLKTAMEYKFNFFMMVIAGMLMRTLMMAVAYVLFRNVPTIAGFSEGEVYLIMAFMYISEGMCNLFFDGVWYIPSLVFSGKLDVMLVRPVSPLFQIMSHEIGLQGFGVVVQGVVSLLLAMGSLGWFSTGHLLLCLVFIVCGTAIRVSTYIIGACGVFWMNTDGKNNIPYTMYSIGEFAKYPVNVYPIWMRVILFVVIPFAFIGYVPALLFRGEQVLLYGLALAAMTIAYSFLARTVFYRGIKRYESMGM